MRFSPQAVLKRQQEEQNLESKRQGMANSVVANAEGSAEPKTKIQVRFPKGQRVGFFSLESLFAGLEDCRGKLCGNNY